MTTTDPRSEKVAVVPEALFVELLPGAPGGRATG